MKGIDYLEWQTHALSGVVAGYFATGGMWQGALVGGAAGIIPDLDEPNSKFGKYLRFVSYPLNSLFGHRTLTHSLLFVTITGGVFYLFFELWVSLAVMSGILAHIVGDMFTGTVRLLFPLNVKIGIKVSRGLFLVIDRLFRYALVIVFSCYLLKEMNLLL